MQEGPLRTKKVFGPEVFIFLALLVGFFGLFARTMGMINMLSTMMQTSFVLLKDTVLYITAIAVVAGGLSGLLQEFGVIALVDRCLSLLMEPLFGLPGAASIGAMTTYLSDNPSILALAADARYRRYFKKYQLPALTNLGTGFGMGAIITTFVLGLSALSGRSYALPALIGNIGAVIGSLVSTRLMLIFTARAFGKTAPAEETNGAALPKNERMVHAGSVGSRFLSSMLEGGKSGIQVGIDIIPGVLIICTFVMMLTNGPSSSGAYTGAAFEGIGLLPRIGDKLAFIIKPLFGLQSAEGIAVPITALGSSGAALSVIKSLLVRGLATPHDVAVFTAMCMCWSGYLSTHVAMMSSLKCSFLTGKAIFSHTVGGLCAGIATHLICIAMGIV